MDEADLILSFGYDEDVKAVVAQLPRIYQGMLMSATLSPELDDLKRVVLHSPAILKLEEGETDGELLQFFVSLPVRACDVWTWSSVTQDPTFTF